MTGSTPRLLPWLVGLAALGLAVGLVANSVEGQVPCRRDCPAQYRDPRGCCVPDAPGTKAEKRRPRCGAGEHASGGRCCPHGAEWVPAKRSCVCLAPGGCGGPPPAAAGVPPSSLVPPAGPGAAPRLPAPPAGSRPGDWVPLRPGSFLMGTPFGEASRDMDEAQHTVTLTNAIVVQSTEVTQGEFQALMGYNPSEARCGPSCPVENITWNEAAAYTVALSTREGRSPCYVCTGRGPATFCNPIGTPYSCPGYRLPTEAEWEYAARAGTHWSTYHGDNPPHLMDCQMPNPILDPIAWFCGNGGRTPHQVGTKAPNGWGLYDMLGNVYEWIHDWYADYSPGNAMDPWGPVVGSERVVRGGSFCCTHNRDVRAGERMSEPPAATHHGALGLRVVRRQ